MTTDVWLSIYNHDTVQYFSIFTENYSYSLFKHFTLLNIKDWVVQKKPSNM